MPERRGPALEVGIVPPPLPGHTQRVARRAEDMGFATCLFPDTQTLAGDPYVAAALAASGTTRLRLGPGVTNPLTRDVAVTASAIGTVHVESAGRAILALGRGDSAAAYSGRAPSTTAGLEGYARDLQTYLSGGTVRRGSMDTRIGWLADAGLPKVPLEMAATGPKTIAAAARVADRVSFAVGAAPERIAWALAHARAAAATAGRSPGAVRFGAFLNVVAHRDHAVARRRARAGVGVLAHFSGMPGSDPSSLPARLRPVASQLQRDYEMARHGHADARQATALPDDFVDWFAIAGDPSACRDHLLALAGLGLAYVHVVGGAEPGDTPDELVASQELLAERVLPELA